MIGYVTCLANFLLSVIKISFNVNKNKVCLYCPHQPINTRKAIMALSEELLNILACPKCKGDIYINDTNDGLICDNCKLLYEIRDDIPIMLIDEAKSIEP
jgi:uncharacterized protein YbaR (Trm112 family)